MERKDWVLLALAAADGQSLSPAQLQKSIFLLSRAMDETQRASFYEFVPYHYGPFDSSVYADADQMQLEGLVAINRPLGQRWRAYAATPAGIAEAKKRASQMPADLVDYLRKVVTWTRSVSFPELVRAIYAKYPEFRVNSVFQG